MTLEQNLKAVLRGVELKGRPSSFQWYTSDVDRVPSIPKRAIYEGGSYFGECERDDKGRCLPSGEAKGDTGASTTSNKRESKLRKFVESRSVAADIESDVQEIDAAGVSVSNGIEPTGRMLHLDGDDAWFSTAKHTFDVGGTKYEIHEIDEYEAGDPDDPKKIKRRKRYVAIDPSMGNDPIDGFMQDYPTLERAKKSMVRLAIDNLRDKWSDMDNPPKAASKKKAAAAVKELIGGEVSKHERYQKIATANGWGRVRYHRDDVDRYGWVTLNADNDPPGPRVYIEGGKITAGPAGMEGKSIDQIDKGVAGTKKDGRKDNVPPKHPQKTKPKKGTATLEQRLKNVLASYDEGDQPLAERSGGLAGDVELGEDELESRIDERRPRAEEPELSTEDLVEELGEGEEWEDEIPEGEIQLAEHWVDRGDFFELVEDTTDEIIEDVEQERVQKGLDDDQAREALEDRIRSLEDALRMLIRKPRLRFSKRSLAKSRYSWVRRYERNHTNAGAYLPARLRDDGPYAVQRYSLADRIRRLWSGVDRYDKTGEGRWVTLGPSGTHVYLEDGEITAGPEGLEGKAISDVDSKPTSTPRKRSEVPSKKDKKLKAKRSKASSSATSSAKETAGKLNVDLKDVASMVGAPDDATVKVRGLGPVLEITISHPMMPEPARRSMGRDDKGRLYIENEFIKIYPPGTGLGSEIFASQVAFAKESGVDYIKCHAAKEGGYNGYYTWPRFGYDAYIDELGDEHIALQSKIEQEFPGAETVLDIMKTKKGRDWWKENGVDIVDARFDLSEESQSVKILEAYLDEREKRQAA